MKYDWGGDEIKNKEVDRENDGDGSDDKRERREGLEREQDEDHGGGDGEDGQRRWLFETVTGEVVGNDGAEKWPEMVALKVEDVYICI